MCLPFREEAFSLAHNEVKLGPEKTILGAWMSKKYSSEKTIFFLSMFRRKELLIHSANGKQSESLNNLKNRYG